VLIVLRWRPPMGWLAGVGPLDRFVTLINSRAVTIYLWHNTAIAAVWPVLAMLTLDDLNEAWGAAAGLLAALLLTSLAVLAFGWAEDLAARRRPRLWPDVTAPAVAPAQKPPDPPIVATAPYRAGAVVPMTHAIRSATEEQRVAEAQAERPA
jgi:peptidoglycan/LPS O-acetylase OafA/YrhL